LYTPLERSDASLTKFATVESTITVPSVNPGVVTDGGVGGVLVGESPEQLVESHARRRMPIHRQDVAMIVPRKKLRQQMNQ
jgi:hypothetical protein